MSLGSTREDTRPALSLLSQFDAFMERMSARKLGQTMEFGANPAIPSMVSSPAEAMRRADRDARLPVSRYLGFSVFIDPSLAPGAWEIRGQGRVEMAKSTFTQLTAEIERRNGRKPLDDGDFGI